MLGCPVIALLLPCIHFAHPGVFVPAQWAECACRPVGSAGGSNLGRQAASAWAWRGRINIARQLSGTNPFRLTAILGLKCIAGMKATQCTARSRFGPNPYWRSPHFRAEGMAGGCGSSCARRVRGRGECEPKWLRCRGAACLLAHFCARRVEAFDITTRLAGGQPNSRKSKRVHLHLCHPSSTSAAASPSTHTSPSTSNVDI